MLNIDVGLIQKITILYVDNEVDDNDLFLQQLRKKVSKVYIANNGEDGYETYIKYNPDIIITDIQMPKLNGIDMIKKIRENDLEVAIFVATSSTEIELIAQYLYLNIYGYLLKPIDEDELFSMLIDKIKLIIAEKENKKYIQMLQLIINADTHMLAVTDLNTISFSNKTFKNFMNFDDVNEFNNTHDKFIDIFLEQENYLHKGMLKENETFTELMFKTDPTKRNVMIFDFHNFKPRAFYFTLTPIDIENGKNIYLATFIDISYMTLKNVAITHKAYYDNLTNIYNRNKIDEVLHDLIAKANRYENIFSIILIDIDHFKKFNDTYGHLIGDEVLVLLATTINKITRDTDTFARWGGEEFLLILPHTTKENSIIVAEHFRKNVEKMLHNKAGKITASFGITEYEKGDTEQSMYEKCDKALYRAKENGRNRVEVE